MSLPPPTKRPRQGPASTDWLPHLLHLGGVSNAALAEILRKLKVVFSIPMVGGGRSHIYETTQRRFLSLRRTLELPLEGGGVYHWEFMDPSAMIGQSIAESPRLAEAFRASMLAHPCALSSPWTLCVGFDEFAPGNKLKTDNRRKTMVLSVTFLQLGQAALCD